MSNDFIVFGKPDIQQSEIDEVVDTMTSTWLGTGPKVKKFEEEFAAYKGVAGEYAAAVSSCTAALHVAMIAADIGPGDEVITTAMTFCATINAILHTGATPILVDIDPQSVNIDVEQIEAQITPRTKAILPVHFAGRPCDMDRLVALANKYDLKLIEDCAHAIETQWKGQTAGTFGDFGCFSFYVTKNIVTGEGGMVLARSAMDINRIKILALHGMSKDAWHRFGDSGYKHYEVVEAGFKYNMMDIQAAIGIHQLARVSNSWERRQKIWKHYQKELADTGLRLPADPQQNTRHGYHLYTVLADAEECAINRDNLMEQLASENIGVGVHYQSIPSHRYYRDRFNWSEQDYPNARHFGERTISLPLSAALTDSDVERIVAAVKKHTR